MGEFVKFFTPMKSFVENFILLIIEANNAWRVWSQRSHANRFIKLQTMKKKEVKLKRTKGVLESVIYIKTSSSNIRMHSIGQARSMLPDFTNYTSWKH